MVELIKELAWPAFSASKGNRRAFAYFLSEDVEVGLCTPQVSGRERSCARRVTYARRACIVQRAGAKGLPLMNRPILAALLAATALSSGLAWADPKDNRGGGQPDQGQQRQGNRPAQAQRQPQQQPQRQPQAQRQSQPQAERQPQAQAQHQPQAERQPRAQRQSQPQVERQPQAQAQRQARQPAEQSHQAQSRLQSRTEARPQAQTQVQRQGGAAPRGGGFSYGGRQHEQIRAPSYSYPQGYGYRRWGIGQDLPLLFAHLAVFLRQLRRIWLRPAASRLPLGALRTGSAAGQPSHGSHPPSDIWGVFYQALSEGRLGRLPFEVPPPC